MTTPEGDESSPIDTSLTAVVKTLNRKTAASRQNITNTRDTKLL